MGRKSFSVVFGLLLLLAFPGLFLFAIIVRLGLQQSYEVYGAGFTIIAGLGVLPVLLAIGFLFDKQQGHHQR